ncbi:hypothetical protein FHX57_006797 [Paraburkholderia tropica]|nr:hypothetical protein [Paraburkholderia tropica]
MSDESWRRRPLEVRILDRCDECETLQPDVRKRVNYWPSFTVICCAACYAKRLAEYEGLSYG